MREGAGHGARTSVSSGAGARAHDASARPRLQRVLSPRTLSPQFGGADALTSKLHELGLKVHRRLTNTCKYAICSDAFLEALVTRGERKDELKNEAWVDKAKDEYGMTIVAERNLKKMLP